MSGYLADWPVNIEQVNEALAEYDGTQYLIPRDAMQTVVEAARRFVAGWETCPTCGGTLWIPAFGRSRGGFQEACPVCVDGMIPGREAQRRAALAIRAVDEAASDYAWGEWDEAEEAVYMERALAGLLASRREEQDATS